MTLNDVDKIYFTKGRINIKIQLPTEYCNFNCPYCFEGHNHFIPSKQQIIETEEKIFNIIKRIKKIYKGEKIILNFLGGETCFYNFIPSLSLFKEDKNVEFVFTTNFTLPIEYYINLSKKINNVEYYISYHEENLDSFFKKVKILNYVKKPTVSVLVGENTTIDLINEINKKAIENNVRVRFSILWRGNHFAKLQDGVFELLNKYNDNTDEGLEAIINGKKTKLILSQTYSLFYPDNLNFIGYTCRPVFSIYMNGDVKFDCFGDKIFGNIFEIEDLSFFTTEVKCNRRCTAIFDYQVISKS
jgi:organic radical activating enzyme